VSPPARHDPAADGWAFGGEPVVPPSPSTVDLHPHTTRSDGVLAPARLVADAHAAGVRLLAITDHDTLAGYRDVVASGLVPADVTLVPGVEINALVTRDLGLWEGELHVLGFGMDPGDAAFEAAMAAQRDQRRLRFQRTVDRLRELGLPIDAQIAALTPGDDDALGRPTIARALIAAGFAVSVEDAFSRLIGHGKPGYVARQGLGPEDAIRVIVAAGGVPVLAHFREAATRLDLLRELVGIGLAGLEVHYRAFDQPTTESVARVASDLGLLATGGTDYHGDLGPYAESHARLWVPPDAGERLLERIAATSRWAPLRP
jgi:predicted metal-dependent phosphoesterase TrpH